MTRLTKVQQRFCEQLSDSSRFVELFSYLPDIYLFCKNLKGQFIFEGKGMGGHLPHIGISDELIPS